MSTKRIKYTRLRKLAEKIWKHLNGKYDSFDKEVNWIAETIETEFELATKD